MVLIRVVVYLGWPSSRFHCVSTLYVILFPAHRDNQHDLSDVFPDSKTSSTFRPPGFGFGGISKVRRHRLEASIIIHYDQNCLIVPFKPGEYKCLAFVEVISTPLINPLCIHAYRVLDFT